MNEKVAIPEKFNRFMVVRKAMINGLIMHGPNKKGDGKQYIEVTDAKLAEEMGKGIHPHMPWKPISDLLNHCVAVELTDKGAEMMDKLQKALAPEPKKEARAQKPPISIDDALKKQGIEVAEAETETPGEDKEPQEEGPKPADMTDDELKAKGKELKIKGAHLMARDTLIIAIEERLGEE